MEKIYNEIFKEIKGKKMKSQRILDLKNEEI